MLGCTCPSCRNCDKASCNPKPEQPVLLTAGGETMHAYIRHLSKTTPEYLEHEHGRRNYTMSESCRLASFLSRVQECMVLSAPVGSSEVCVGVSTISIIVSMNSNRQPGI